MNVLVFILLIILVAQFYLCHKLKKQFFKYKNDDLLKNEIFLNIRNSLSLINIMGGKLIKKEIKNQEELKEIGDSIFKRSNELIFQLGKSINNNFGSKPNVPVLSYNINDFVVDCLAQFIDKATTEQIKFKVYLPNNNIKIWIDYERMVSIIYNLMINAFEETTQGGVLTVKLRVYRKRWELLVHRSTKIHSTAVYRKRAKSNFNYKDSNVGQNPIYTRINLINYLVHCHCGDMMLRSYKSWESWKISFPLNSHYYEKKSPVVEVENKPEKCFFSNISIVKPYIPIHTDLQPKKTILLVENDRVFNRYLTSFIQERYNVIQMYDSKAALTRVRKLDIDMVIVDSNMPKISGYELCIIIKQDKNIAFVPVVLLSVNLEHDKKIKEIKTLADAIITKPIDVPLFLAKLDNIMCNRLILRQKNSMSVGQRDDMSSDVNNSNLRFITALHEAIEKRMSKDSLSVDDLCADMCMCRTNLYNRIKELTGLPPSVYVRNKKLEYARSILLGNKYTISEVATMTGFCDANYFGKVFKQYFHVSPVKLTSNK